MSPTPDPTDCLFAIIIGFALPYHLATAGRDADLARAAILNLIEACHAVATAPRRLVNRLATALNTLPQSIGSALTAAKCLHHRSGKGLEPARLKQRQADEAPALAQPMPMPKPPSISPPRPPAPPREKPPAQPRPAGQAVPAIEPAVEADLPANTANNAPLT